MDKFQAASGIRHVQMMPHNHNPASTASVSGSRIIPERTVLNMSALLDKNLETVLSATAFIFRQDNVENSLSPLRAIGLKTHTPKIHSTGKAILARGTLVEILIESQASKTLVVALATARHYY